MSEATRTHYCADGPERQLPVEWDDDAEAYVTTKRCPDCGTMFEVFVE
jgi:hypothetical protein